MIRYDLVRRDYREGSMEAMEDGEWVRYEDAMDAITKERVRVDAIISEHEGGKLSVYDMIIRIRAGGR